MGNSQKKGNGKQLLESLGRTLMHEQIKREKDLFNILNKSRKIWPSYMCISLALFFFDAFIINSYYININFHCKPTKPIERMYIAVVYYVHIYYN